MIWEGYVWFQTEYEHMTATDIDIDTWQYDSMGL